MATKILTKQEFVKFINENVEDDEFVLFSADMVGSLKVVKKRNIKEVTFGYAADAFKESDGIGHFAFGRTPVVSFSVCNKSQLSQSSLDLIAKKVKPIIAGSKVEWTYNHTLNSTTSTPITKTGIVKRVISGEVAEVLFDGNKNTVKKPLNSLKAI